MYTCNLSAYFDILIVNTMTKTHRHIGPKVYLALGIAIIMLIALTFYKRAYVQEFLVVQHGIDVQSPILFFDRRNDAEFYFIMGNIFFGEGAVYDVARAEKYYKKALELDERLPFAHYQLARVYFVTGELNKGIKQINLELEYFPENKRSYYIRGLLYGYQGALGAAASDFKKFLEWKPNSWAGHNDLAWVYFQQGDYYNTYVTAVAGLEFSPGNPWLLNSEALALMNSDNPEEAYKIFTEALASAEKLSHTEWGMAYPGNDPEYYPIGLNAMVETIKKNLELTKEQIRIAQNNLI